MGDFISQKIENVLKVSYSQPLYRNKFLVDSLMVFHMIDIAALGICRGYNIQKAKYFPLPDYNVFSGVQVELTVYGKSLNDHQDLDLQTVFLAQQVQKGVSEAGRRQDNKFIFITISS